MTKIATLKHNPSTNKWEASYAGQVFLKSTSKDYVVDKIVNQISEKAKALGVTQVVEAGGSLNQVAQTLECSAPELVFGINERFDILEDFVDMVATRTIPSVVVTGTGGLGKSHTVMKALRKAGLTQVKLNEVPQVVGKGDDDDDEEVESFFSVVDIAAERKKFIVVKGFSTAKALYRTLFENRHKVIVFDDTDVTKDPVAQDLLKAALDSYDERVVTWGSESFVDDGLPRSFEFCGGVILITNKPMYKIPQPIISRSMAADVSMTRLECVERMRAIVLNKSGDDEFLPEYKKEDKLQALAFIEEYADHRQVRSVNMRTLIGVTKALVAKPQHWQRLALYAMVNAGE